MNLLWKMKKINCSNDITQKKWKGLLTRNFLRYPIRLLEIFWKLCWLRRFLYYKSINVCFEKTSFALTWSRDQSLGSRQNIWCVMVHNLPKYEICLCPWKFSNSCYLLNLQTLFRNKYTVLTSNRSSQKEF